MGEKECVVKKLVFIKSKKKPPNNINMWTQIKFERI